LRGLELLLDLVLRRRDGIREALHPLGQRLSRLALDGDLPLGRPAGGFDLNDRRLHAPLDLRGSRVEAFAERRDVRA
jgi:hypothetical protein